jgi:hypothetical protein
LHNQADPFGSYARWGTRLVRALFTVAAAAPALLSHGKAQVAVGDRRAIYLLDRDTTLGLTARSGAVHCAPGLPDLRGEWARWKAAQGTDGWRLVSSPEPVLCAAGLGLAPFACHCGETRVLLWPVESPGHLDDAARLGAAGVDVLPLVAEDLHAAPPAGMPWVAGGQPAAIVAALTAHWGGRRVDPAVQALAALLDQLDVRGYIAEPDVAEVLGCATTEDLPRRLRTLDGSRAVYIPGLGLCSPAFAEQMRRGLRRRPRRRPAA